ncbi:MAG: 5-formyltetrahydrofolate cyclo-ligase, partial [Alphaproteobacteria bacterium]|nr:5-formyltetrahydrofolate cyclo-ligase [Alphaproteobacteria bacterium]
MEAAEVKLWRKAERERLIALRQSLPPEERRRRGARIEAALRDLLAERPGILGVYWPFRAEFDPRSLIDWAIAAGRTVALPV